MPFRLAMFFIAMVPIFQQAQTHPMVGSWKVLLGTPQVASGGGVEMADVDGTMIVTATGDSLIAMLTLASPPGYPPREPQRLAGVRKDGEVSLAYSYDATFVENREPSTRRATVTLVLKMKGDAMNGEMYREINGQIANPRQEFSATRVHR